MSKSVLFASYQNKIGDEYSIYGYMVPTVFSITSGQCFVSMMCSIYGQSLKFRPFSFDVSVNSATDPILKYGIRGGRTRSRTSCDFSIDTIKLHGWETGCAHALFAGSDVTSSLIL